VSSFIKAGQSVTVSAGFAAKVSVRAPGFRDYDHFMAHSTPDPEEASSPTSVAKRLWALRAAQFVGAWAVGSLLTTCVVPLLIFGMLFGGGAGILLMSIPVGIVATVGLLIVVASLTRGASALTLESRVGWAILVFVAGTVGWIVGALIFQGEFPGPRGAVLVYGGIPFALAAAGCMGRWVSAIALLVAVALLTGAPLLHMGH
jgi:hypothetical protein